MATSAETATPSFRPCSLHATPPLPGVSLLCGLRNFPLWPFCISRSMNCCTGIVTDFFCDLVNFSLVREKHCHTIPRHHYGGFLRIQLSLLPSVDKIAGLLAAFSWLTSSSPWAKGKLGPAWFQRGARMSISPCSSFLEKLWLLSCQLNPTAGTPTAHPKPVLELRTSWRMAAMRSVPQPGVLGRHR